MLDGRVLEASQVEYKPFGKPALQREAAQLPPLVFEVQAWQRTRCTSAWTWRAAGARAGQRPLRGARLAPEGFAGRDTGPIAILDLLRVLSFPGWGTTVCDVATLEHTISFGSKGMSPLFVQALRTRDAPDLGAWYPLIVGLALCSSVTERVPFWYLRRRLQTGPHSSFRVPLGGGLPGLTLEHFPVPEGVKACEPILSPTWGLSGVSSQEPQPSVGHALQTIAAHASDLQDALLQVSMPAIAGLALRRPKAAPATRLTVDFGAVGQASAPPPCAHWWCFYAASLLARPRPVGR